MAPNVDELLARAGLTRSKSCVMLVKKLSNVERLGLVAALRQADAAAAELVMVLHELKLDNVDLSNGYSINQDGWLTVPVRDDAERAESDNAG